MERRRFLALTALSGLSAHLGGHSVLSAMSSRRGTLPVPKRRYKDGVDLSIIGFGGIVLMGMQQDEANAVVGEVVDRGINYFDVAPSYGNGEAEEKLGPALRPFRKGIFLACKTTVRDAAGAEAELHRSLKRLHTDHFDLYQFHAVTRTDEVERIFEPGGAMEAFLRAREVGKIRHIGFSAHSEEAAIAMIDRFPFDSVLFPFNLTCYARSKFGPAVMEAARKKGVARLALKMLAHGPWPAGAERTYPNAWYKPIDNPEEARTAVRFTLSEDVTAAIPPGDIRLFRMAVRLAAEFTPLSTTERREFLAGVSGNTPLFPL